jgi:hypothetical protein
MDTPCLLSCNRSCSPCSCCERCGLWPELIDAAQDLCEQRSRHRHLGQLEHHVAAVAYDPGRCAPGRGACAGAVMSALRSRRSPRPCSVTRSSGRSRLTRRHGCGEHGPEPPPEPPPRQVFAHCPRCEEPLVQFVYLDSCPRCSLDLRRIRAALMTSGSGAPEDARRAAQGIMVLP